MGSLSIIICAYNPNLDYLKKVLFALKEQTLSRDKWELIIVDNNSSNYFADNIDLSWHPSARVIRESAQGLIFARIAGTLAAKFDLIVTVDDDTILDESYLENCSSIFEAYPDIGIFGGRSKALFESDPPQWIKHFNTILCIKDLGEQPIITQLFPGEKLREFPDNGPFLIAYRRNAFLDAFLPHFRSNVTSQNLGRKGKSLASGEDNDITLAIYKAGYKVGYFPELWFTHIVPKRRTEKAYLASLIKASNKSWVQVLAIHNIFPWSPVAAWTIPARKAKAYVRMKAWASDLNYIRWCGACGIFEGRASINKPLN